VGPSRKLWKELGWPVLQVEIQDKDLVNLYLNISCYRRLGLELQDFIIAVKQAVRASVPTAHGGKWFSKTVLNAADRF
jgi:hypothetical protein